MIRLNYSLFIYLFLISQALNAQVAVREWRDYLPYNHSICVSATDKMIVATTEFALITYNINTSELSKFSQVQGLSDTKISFAKFSPWNNLLLVAYQNGNLDLIENMHVFNISDIYRAVIPGMKAINNALFIENLAYLSCDFGIVVLDLERREVKETYYIGEYGSYVRVFELALQASTLWAATEHGLLTADIKDPLLVDYTHWQKVSGIPGASGNFNTIVSIDEQILTNHTNTSNHIDSVYLFNNVTWSFFTHNNGKIESLSVSNSKLTVNGNGKILIYDDNLDLITEINKYGWSNPEPYYSILDESGNLWIADNESGLFRTKDFVSFDYLTPEGPYTKNAFTLLHQDNTLFVAGGAITDTWSNNWIHGEFFKFSNGKWQNNIIPEAIDIVNIIPSPVNPDHIYAASWGEGLLEISGSGKLINKFKSSNSSLQALQSDQNVVRTCGLLFDNSQNLWITNSQVNDPVSVLSPSGDWNSLHFNGLISNVVVGPIYETENNDKWITIPRESKLLVFNNSGTTDYEADDNRRLIYLKDDEGNSFNSINCLSQDLDGTIWIGTNLGPVVLYNPEEALEGGSMIAQRIKIPRDDNSGLADYLLSTERITSIVIDGANRKWIGTEEAGIFLQSADGIETLASFNSENSPLSSNWITSIAINEKSGEVFIGTDEGIYSYRGEATAGVSKMTMVYVFPNPVREDYSGPVTITGLVTDADVKITDINGNLIFKTKALGGQAIWDGKTSFGKRASTGVYLVFISNNDGSETFVTKILFIN